MIEKRDTSSASNLYGKFLALVEVNGVRYCPFRYEIYEERGYNYMRSWMLLTSQDGTTSNPTATTLYEKAETVNMDEGSWEATYKSDVWPDLGVVGPCTFEQALQWLNADGATYTIVRL